VPDLSGNINRGFLVPERYPQHRRFVIFERNLLCQHDVANRNILRGQEAPHGNPTPAVVQFVDIHLPCGANAVSLPAMGAPYLKIPSALVLGALCWRQPFLQEVGGAPLSFAAPPVRADTVVGSDLRQE
jgi:hypothetical protein